jgi:mono/diheme cytochrome c family protein
MRSIGVLGLALAVAACGSQKPPPDAYANGRSIFMTGRDIAGHKITASPAPLQSSCMACHNANGSGGKHLRGGAVSADLRHKALVTDQHPPYTVTLLERAISTGVDNQGQKLDPVMPRWRMSKSDLHDVASYVYNRLK